MRLRTQAPSGVRSPSRPSGRKTRIRMRIEKTIDCVQSLPGRVPAQAFVERLDEADAQRAEHGAWQVADPAEHGGGEGDQPELRSRCRSGPRRSRARRRSPPAPGERAGDQERERDRPVDVDAHHRRGVAVLRGRAHRLALPRALHEPDQGEQHGHRDQDDDQLLPRVASRRRSRRRCPRGRTFGTAV